MHLIVRYVAGPTNTDQVVHAKGSQRGDWDQGRWWFNFFSIIRPSIKDIVQNGILLGFSCNKWGKDTFNMRLESGERKDTGARHLV